jgi:hypothetical protein
MPPKEPEKSVEINASGGAEAAASRPTPDERKVCGIVMPISAIGEEYSEEHWRRVRKVLQRAIERAGMRPQLVWENPEVDVIQSAILQNLYENDVVICDVSGLNSNVMLETGLRLSTKRPTIIVTDRVQRPPFDISTIGYIEYQRDLEYNSTDDFIERLRKKLSDVVRADTAGEYKSFVEQFRFETVTPTKVNVTSDEFLRERLAELTSIAHRIERSQRMPAATSAPTSRQASSQPRRPRIESLEVGKLSYRMLEELADEAEDELDSMFPDVFSIVEQEDEDAFTFVIKKYPGCKINERTIMRKAVEILNRYQDRYQSGL